MSIRCIHCTILIINYSFTEIFIHSLFNGIYGNVGNKYAFYVHLTVQHEYEKITHKKPLKLRQLQFSSVISA